MLSCPLERTDTVCSRPDLCAFVFAEVLEFLVAELEAHCPFPCPHFVVNGWDLCGCHLALTKSNALLYNVCLRSRFFPLGSKRPPA